MNNIEQLLNKILNNSPSSLELNKTINNINTESNITIDFNKNDITKRVEEDNLTLLSNDYFNYLKSTPKGNVEFDKIIKLLKLKYINFNTKKMYKDYDGFDMRYTDTIPEEEIIQYIFSLKDQNILTKIERFLNSGKLSVLQELRIIEGFRNIISWLYTEEGQLFFTKHFQNEDFFNLEERNLVIKENYDNINEYLNDITLQELENIDNFLLKETQSLKQKINSIVVEEGAWFDEYILKCATEKEKISLLKLSKKKDQEGFKNTLKELINKNNDSLGIPHVFSKEGEGYSFTKATSGLPDVVLKTREGGIHFCYANSFENSYMESDQAERHSAILLETMKEMNWYNINDKTGFFNKFKSIIENYKGEPEQRDLWKKIISNKDNINDLYNKVRNNFSISNYQYIGHLQLIEQVLFLQHHNHKSKKDIELWKQNNKEEYEVMKDKINLIKVSLQSLVLEAQEFHNFILKPEEKIYNFSNNDKKIFKSVSVNSPTIMGEQEKSITNTFFKELFEKGDLKSTLLDLISMETKSEEITQQYNSIENEEVLDTNNLIGFWGQTLKTHKTATAILYNIEDFKKDSIEKMDSFLLKFIILNQNNELKLALIEGLLHLLLGKYRKNDFSEEEENNFLEIIKKVIGENPENMSIIKKFLGKISSRNSSTLFTTLELFEGKKINIESINEINKKLEDKSKKLEEQKSNMIKNAIANNAVDFMINTMKAFSREDLDSYLSQQNTQTNEVQIFIDLMAKNNKNDFLKNLNLEYLNKEKIKNISLAELSSFIVKYYFKNLEDVKNVNQQILKLEEIGFKELPPKIKKELYIKIVSKFPEVKKEILEKYDIDYDTYLTEQEKNKIDSENQKEKK